MSEAGTRTADQGPVVYIVDDDDAIRDSLTWLLESVRLKVKSYATAQAFLDDYSEGACGCLIVDIRMPGMSGLELLERLSTSDITLPVIIVTGHGDVPSAVRAMKLGAVDFLEKPIVDQMLLDRVQQSIEAHRKLLDQGVRFAEVEERMNRLTPREREIMMSIVRGASNKTIAAELGLSYKTVEVHRSRVMEKMQATSLAALVRMVLHYMKPR